MLFCISLCLRFMVSYSIENLKTCRISLFSRNTYALYPRKECKREEVKK